MVVAHFWRVAKTPERRRIRRPKRIRFSFRVGLGVERSERSPEHIGALPPLHVRVVGLGLFQHGITHCHIVRRGTLSTNCDTNGGVEGTGGSMVSEIAAYRRPTSLSVRLITKIKER